MDQSQSASAPKDESPRPSSKDPSRAGDPVSKPTSSQVNAVDTWSLIVTGCISAALLASLSSRLPSSHTLSWTTIFVQSIFLIVLTAVGGTAGISIPWFFLRIKPSFGLSVLSQSVAVGWLFFPCITLLYRQRSPWMLFALALSTIAVTLSIRQLLPVTAGTDRRNISPPRTGELTSLYGLPLGRFRPLRAFSIALCAQAALPFAVAGYLFIAGIFLSTCLFLYAWRWSAFDSAAIKRFAGKKPFVLLSVFALLLTVLALTPWIAARPQEGSNLPRRPALAARRPLPSDPPGSEYIGIILWPPPVEKKMITPPRPHAPFFVKGRAAKPVVIPFDGPYWYFKAPGNGPGSRAHIAHGKATDVNINSSNSSPLMMEAHQNLGPSIELQCCSEIDVAITNADARPGAIALGIRLTDSESIGRPFQYLAERTIASSAAANIPLDRPPVKETLRFPMPRSSVIRRFDQITIVFRPAATRARGGAKVSIQSFTLVPR